MTPGDFIENGRLRQIRNTKLQLHVSTTFAAFWALTTLTDDEICARLFHLSQARAAAQGI